VKPAVIGTNPQNNFYQILTIFNANFTSKQRANAGVSTANDAMIIPIFAKTLAKKLAFTVKKTKIFCPYLNPKIGL
jgi:hypothetical protein